MSVRDHPTHTAGSEPGPGDVPDAALAVDKRIVAGWLVIAVAIIPMAWWGPGTDLDVRYVIDSGRSLIRHGVYRASRPPGAPVHEAIVGVLDRIGGIALSNLGTLAATSASVVLLVLILRHERVPRPALVASLLVTNPWFIVASTSTVDFPWALALFLGAAYVLRSRAGLRGAALAGVLGAVAVGTRSSTIVILVALAGAEAFATDEGGRRSINRAAVFLGVALLGGLFYLAPYLEVHSLEFARNEFETSSLPVQVGRFLAKDLYLFGPFAAVGLLLALPQVLRTLKAVRTDWLVRVGLGTLVMSQAVYLRFPWKMAHLLPTVVAVAFILGRALAGRPRLLAGIVVAQFLFCFASIQLLEPDTPSRSTGGRVRIRPTVGMVVRDIQCRNEDRDAFSAGEFELGVVWNCVQPWSDEPDATGAREAEDQRPR